MTNYINASPDDKVSNYNEHNNGFMRYDPTIPTNYINQEDNKLDYSQFAPTVNNLDLTLPKTTSTTGVGSSIVDKPAVTISDDNKAPIVNLPVAPVARKRMNIPRNKITDAIDQLNVSDNDKEYLRVLGDRESSFNPNASTTSKGVQYRGLYQFGNGALSQIGMSPADYDGNINNQFMAALKFGKMNIAPYRSLIGKTVDGVNITENGLMAAAHLGGSGGLKALLNGQVRRDKYGTSTLDYMKMFDK